jgi:anthranilate synthase component 1
MKLVALYPKKYGTKKALDLFSKELQAVQAKLKKPLLQEPKKRKVSSAFKPNMTKREFVQIVNRIKEYIRAGDVIQTVPSQRFDLGKMEESFTFYRTLRSLNPSPYMFFFKHKDLELAGSSPELLVRKIGHYAEVRPIAGTRPRGATELKDKAYEDQLRKSVKERAEHLMLVDLARNDLGRVSEFASVKVKAFERVERYSHVMHLVSDVMGHMKESCDGLDLLRSVFPAGTLSGAPKVRAMEIIDELEPTERGPYGGSLGYLSYNGDIDMCITIRTLMNLKKQASVQAGAGIVFDSNPGREYEECLNKAKALFKAFKGDS